MWGKGRDCGQVALPGIEGRELISYVAYLVMHTIILFY